MGKNPITISDNARKCAVLPCPCTELIIGNVSNVMDADAEAVEEWEIEKQCSTEVSNAVTRQQSAVLLRESEKSTIDMTHVDSHTQVQQNSDANRHQQTHSGIQLGNDLKLVTQDNDSTLPTLERQDKTLKICCEKKSINRTSIQKKIVGVKMYSLCTAICNILARDNEQIRILNQIILSTISIVIG